MNYNENIKFMWKITIESKKQMILRHYKVWGAHPIYKVLWNWMAHPKCMPQLIVASLLKTKL